MQKFEHTLFVTGGAGFIGSAYLNYAVPEHPNTLFVNIDSLTTASDLGNVTVSDQPNYRFEKADIRDLTALATLFKQYQPNGVVNFAAETHVDISLKIPFLFVETNVIGAHNLLSLARDYKVTRFLQISTDEVYGSLGPTDPAFTEESPLKPNNPYSASKASADCLVRSYHETWGLDTVITRTSNNYGPNQYHNKLIPRFVKRLMKGMPMTIHGTGKNVRDWIYVEDNVRAIDLAYHKGRAGEIYNVGAHTEKTNLEIAEVLASLAGKDPKTCIIYVEDRPGNDERYALDTTKIERELGWKPSVSFTIGMQKTFEHFREERGAGSKTEQRGIFIQTNRKQMLGAKIAKYVMETRGKAKEHGIPVTIMEVEKVPAFERLKGKQYRKGYAPYSLDDLQSFTLTRFMPPELMHYAGMALVIDPDIFALTDVTALFNLDLGTAAIAACRKKEHWDTSVMLLDCPELTHWSIARIIDDIGSGTRIYEDIAQLRDEKVEIMEIPRIWNNLDTLTPDTKMLHTTNRLTQPWKTGLPIDFTQNPMPKYFGLIPREPVHKLLGKYQTRYQPHPDKKIEQLFFDLAREAYAGGAVTKADIEEGIKNGDLRPDLPQKLGLV